VNEVTVTGLLADKSTHRKRTFRHMDVFFRLLDIATPRWSFRPKPKAAFRLASFRHKKKCYTVLGLKCPYTGMTKYPTGPHRDPPLSISRNKFLSTLSISCIILKISIKSLLTLLVVKWTLGTTDHTRTSRVASHGRHTVLC